MIYIFSAGDDNSAIATASLIGAPFVVSAITRLLTWPLHFCFPKLRHDYDTYFWKNPFWQLPFVQLILNWHYLDEIKKAGAKRKPLVVNLENALQTEREAIEAGASNKRLNQVRGHVKQAEDAKLEASRDLSRLETNYMVAKIFEAFFESGPQFVLQLVLLLKVGNVSKWTVFTILTSLLKFTWTSVSLYSKMPTARTPLRKDSLTNKLAILSFPWLLITGSRLLAWTLTVAYLGIYSLIMLLVSLLIQILCLHKHLRWNWELVILRLLTAIVLPCIPYDEYDRSFFWSSAASTLTHWIAMSFVFMMRPGRLDFSNPPLTTCFPVTSWTVQANQTRCLLDPDSLELTENCTDQWFFLGADSDNVHNYRTVCQPNQDEYSYLWVFYGIITGALVLNVILTIGLQKYLDPLNRLWLTSKCCCSSYWTKFYNTKKNDVLSILNGENQEEHNLRRILYTAIQDDIPSLVELILSRIGGTPDSALAFFVSDNSHPVLHTYASYGSTAGIKRFLDLHLKLCSQLIQNSNTDDVEANQQGQLQARVLQVLNKKNRFGKTACQVAVQSKNDKFLDLMLDHHRRLLDLLDNESMTCWTLGMNLLEIGDNQPGMTLLHEAIKARSPKMLKRILEHHGFLYNKMDQGLDQIVDKIGLLEQTMTNVIQRLKQDGSSILNDAARIGDPPALVNCVLSYHAKLCKKLFTLCTESDNPRLDALTVGFLERQRLFPGRSALLINSRLNVSALHDAAGRGMFKNFKRILDHHTMLTDLLIQHQSPDLNPEQREIARLQRSLRFMENTADRTSVLHFACFTVNPIVPKILQCHKKIQGRLLALQNVPNRRAAILESTNRFLDLKDEVGNTLEDLIKSDELKTPEQIAATISLVNSFRRAKWQFWNR